MSLRRKTLLIIGLTIVSLLAVLYTTSRIILLSSFAGLEEQHTRQNVERALSALSDELYVLDTMVFDWASWDDTYAFIEDANEDYIESNLVDETFVDPRLNFMLFVHSSGQTVFGKGFDLQNEEEVPVPQSLLEHLADNVLLLRHPDTESSAGGIVLLPEGPMLVASRPILTSEEEGPIRGTLMMGRYLTPAEIERLAEITHLSLTVRRLNDPQMPPDFQAVQSSLSEEEPIFVRPRSGESVDGYALLEDIYGEPALVLRADMPREIYKHGQASISFFVLSLLAVGLVFGAMSLWHLDKYVLSRLAHLNRSVSNIGTSGDLSARVAMAGTDEVSSLSGAINGMLEALEQSEEALQESEKRYRPLFKRTGNVILVIDTEGNYLDCSQGALQFAECTRDELLTKNIRDFIPPGKVSQVLGKHQPLRGGGATVETKYFVHGKVKILELTITPTIWQGKRVVFGVGQDITERKQAEEEIRQRTAQLEALRQASLRLTSTLELQPILEAILDHTLNVVASDDAHIFLYDGERLTFGAALWEDGHQQKSYSEPRSQGLTYTVARSGERIVVPDVNSHPLFRDYQWGGAIVGLPLRIGERVVGVMTVAFQKPHVFDESELRVLGLLADQAAIAIENARLYAAQQQRAQERGLLLDIARTTTSTLEMTEVLKLVTQRAAQACGADRCTILLLDKVGKILTPTMSQFASGIVDKKMWRLFKDTLYPRPLAEVPEVQQVLQEGRPLLIPDVLASSLPRHWLEPFNVKSLLVVPMISKKRPIGMMALDRTEEGEGFADEQVNLAMTIGAQAAIAIENARLYEETRQRATELGILYDVATAAAVSIRLDEILNRVMAALQETLRPDDIAILLVEPETKDLVIHAHTGFPGGPTLMRRTIGVGIPGWVVGTGQPALLADVRGDERYHACDPDTRSELCVPLRIGERIIGAINLESRRLAAFSEEDLRLLSILAGHLAVVIEDARLFEEVEERRMYLEGVLGAAPDAIVTLDARHRIAEWNLGAEKLFGYSREEALGRDLDHLVTRPDVLEEATGFRQMVMGGKDLPPVETVRYRKDGSPMDVILASSPILVGDELIGAVAVYTDITERVRAEEVLCRRAEELAALQATVLDITAPHDLPTLLQTIVERAALLLNAPSGGLYLCDPDRGEVRCVVSYNTPSDYTGTVLKYGEGAAGTVAQTGEPLIIDDYRTWRRRAAAYEEEQPFTSVLSAPMIWQDQVTGVIHVLHNVESRRFTEADLELLTLFANHAAIAVENTRLYEQAQKEIAEHMRAEEALRESEERLRSLIETMAEGVVLIAPDGQIVQANFAAERILGLKRSEIEGRNYVGPEWDILRPDGTPMPPDEMAGPRVMKEKHLVKNVVMGVNRPNGPISWINVSAAPLINEGGELDGVVGTFVDITERKRAEEALKKYSERLEEMVEQRTLELRKAYIDLRDSQARLIQSEKLVAIGRLAASVAHEINNPLQGITNYLSLISQQVTKDDPLHEDLEMVKLGFDRIAEIVRRLRAFYRPAGAEMEPTDVNGVVERALALVGHQLSLGKVEVKRELAEQELPVLGSAGQLEQVLVNLALNAQEAMPGGGELTVRTALCEDVVRIQVADTGRGISEEEMSRLFKPFYGGRGSQGLGLGLWISHNIIEGHGGRIEVESQVGEGTTFTISLPAYQ
jgi:PAS domain S-box-containing protein